MRDGILGLINTSVQEDCLQGLTEQRPLAAVPFGGRYRIIDFMLSGMVNGGITAIGVLLQRKYRPLLDYLQSGKAWDLSCKRDGLTFLPYTYGTDDRCLKTGNLYTLDKNREFLLKSQHPYVAIAGTGVVCHLDFCRALAFHKENQAQITLCTAVSNQAEQENRPAVLAEKQDLETAIIDKDVFISLLDSALLKGGQDFFRDAVLPNTVSHRVATYMHKGYAASVTSLALFYRHHMELLERGVWQQLFTRPDLIYTKEKDVPPALYQPGSCVKHSLIAGGCVIGGTIENSILFRGVHVQPGAVVRNSILMNRTIIEQGALVDTVICDKEVRVTAGNMLQGSPSEPAVVKKGFVM